MLNAYYKRLVDNLSLNDIKNDKELSEEAIWAISQDEEYREKLFKKLSYHVNKKIGTFAKYYNDNKNMDPKLHPAKMISERLTRIEDTKNPSFGKVKVEKYNVQPANNSRSYKHQMEEAVRFLRMKTSSVSGFNDYHKKQRDALKKLINKATGRKENARVNNETIDEFIRLMNVAYSEKLWKKEDGVIKYMYGDTTEYHVLFNRTITRNTFDRTSKKTGRKYKEFKYTSSLLNKTNKSPEKLFIEELEYKINEMRNAQERKIEAANRLQQQNGPSPEYGSMNIQEIAGVKLPNPNDMIPIQGLPYFEQ